MAKLRKVQHLRSSVQGKYPTVDQVEYGEITINFYKGDEFLCIRNKGEKEDGSDDTIVSFRTWPYIQKIIQDNELVTSAALTALNEACGFNENGKFIPSADANYISDSKTVTEALNTLDKKLNEIDTEGIDDAVINEINDRIDGTKKEIQTLSVTVSENELVTSAALTALNEACGFSENAEFTPSADASYISEAKTATEALLALDQNLALTYTKSEIDSKGYLTEVPSEYVTESELVSKGYATTSQVATKQDKLTAGEGIAISGNTISCTLDTSLYLVVTTLPSTGEANKIYLVEAKTSGDTNVYIEYAYVNGTWEKLGEYKAEMDLTPYLTKEEANDTYLSQTEANDKYATKESIAESELVTSAALTALNEACGFSENAEFTPSADANYISNSKTVTEALVTLDERIKVRVDDLSQVVSQNQTIINRANQDIFNLQNILAKSNQSNGFNENGEYISNASSEYIKNSSSVTEALNILDKTLLDADTNLAETNKIVKQLKDGSRNILLNTNQGSKGWAAIPVGKFECRSVDGYQDIKYVTIYKQNDIYTGNYEVFLFDLRSEFISKGKQYLLSFDVLQRNVSVDESDFPQSEGLSFRCGIMTGDAKHKLSELTEELNGAKTKFDTWVNMRYVLDAIESGNENNQQRIYIASKTIDEFISLSIKNLQLTERVESSTVAVTDEEFTPWAPAYEDANNFASIVAEEAKLSAIQQTIDEINIGAYATTEYVNGQISETQAQITVANSGITQTVNELITDVNGQVSRLDSKIDQTASGITLSVNNSLAETGIDITNKKIRVKADNFEIVNNNGDVTSNVDYAGRLSSNTFIAKEGNYKRATINENFNGFGRWYYPNSNIPCIEIGWDENESSFLRVYNMDGDMAWKLDTSLSFLQPNNNKWYLVNLCYLGNDYIDAKTMVQTPYNLEMTNYYEINKGGVYRTYSEQRDDYDYENYGLNGWYSPTKEPLLADVPESNKYYRRLDLYEQGKVIKSEEITFFLNN